MQITQELVTKINTLLDSGLCFGVGKPKPGKMCVEAAICYALDLPHGDDPGCVMPSLRRLKIRLNDSRWSTNKARAEGLRRLAIAHGSKGMDEKDFAKRVATMTIRTVVPGALRSAAKRLTGEHSTRLLAIALKCEQEPTLENAMEAKAAAFAAYAAAAYAAAYATAATAAYAYAAYAYAYAAAADADAAAYATAAYATAAYAAYAYAYAAAADADAAATAAYAAAAAATDKLLAEFAENVVQILIDMKAPGTEWLKAAA